MKKLEPENMSMLDANKLIARSLLAFENEKRSILNVSDYPPVYYDLKNWFESSTEKKYTLGSVKKYIEECERIEKEWEEDKERIANNAFGSMFDENSFNDFFDKTEKSNLKKIFDDEMISKINNALDFKLSEWQIAYLRGSGVLKKGKETGKTAIFIIKTLLETDDILDLTDHNYLYSAMDENKRMEILEKKIPVPTYIQERTFKNYLRSYYEKLNENGVRTRSVIFKKED